MVDSMTTSVKAIERRSSRRCSPSSPAARRCGRKTSSRRCSSTRRSRPCATSSRSTAGREQEAIFASESAPPGEELDEIRFVSIIAFFADVVAEAFGLPQRHSAAVADFSRGQQVDDMVPDTTATRLGYSAQRLRRPLANTLIRVLDTLIRAVPGWRGHDALAGSGWTARGCGPGCGSHCWGLRDTHREAEAV